jgi:hypothetical protein
MKPNPPSYLGPHEGRELELMRSGVKPLSMFTEDVPSEYEIFDEKEFDRLVEQKTLLKGERTETISTRNGVYKLRRVLYAQESQGWRIPAMFLVNDVYRSLIPGFRPDLERMTGLLLGYDRADIEMYIESKEGGRASER